MTGRLVTDAISGHLIYRPSPTCMKQIGETGCLHCVLIVTGKEIFIGENTANQYKGKKASELKQQSVLLPAAESYAPLVAFIINACKKMHCSDDVEKFKIKLDSLNGVGAVLNQP